MRKILVIAVALCALLCSCSKEQRAIAYANQNAKIEAFVNKALAADNTAQVFRNEGSTRVVVSSTDEGSGDELNARGTVTFEYAGYDFSSGSISASALFATNNSSVAMSSGWSSSATFEPVTLSLQSSDMLEGLRLGLVGVRTGQVCTILFPGKLGFGDEKNGTVARNAPLAFKVWVKEIQN